MHWIWISYKTEPTEVWANIRAGLRVSKRSHGATCRRPSSSTVKKSTISVPQMGPTSSEIATSSALVVSLCLSALFCIKISETALEFYTLYLRPLIFFLFIIHALFYFIYRGISFIFFLSEVLLQYTDIIIKGYEDLNAYVKFIYKGGFLNIV